MTDTVTEPLMNTEANQLILTWPQMTLTLQIGDASAPIGLCHDENALREHKIVMISSVLPETPASIGGVCGNDVIEMIGCHNAAAFLLEGGEISAAAQEDGTLALGIRRPPVEVPVTDAHAAAPKVEAAVSEGAATKKAQLKKNLEADMAPTPLRKRNPGPCKHGKAGTDVPKRNRSEAEHLAESMCGRCGVHAVSKRKALQKKSLCCNNCPNHGPWCTMHDAPICSKNPDKKATKHEQGARGNDAGRKIPERAVEHEDGDEEDDSSQTDKIVHAVPEMEVEDEGCIAHDDEAGKMELARSRMIKVEDPAEKLRRAAEEKRVKADEKRLKAEDEKRLKAEEKRLKAEGADEEKRLKAEEKTLKAEEEKRLKAEEKRLKAEFDMARVESKAALQKIEQAELNQKKMLDAERKQQNKRQREEEKALMADVQKRIRSMGKAIVRGPAAQKAAEEKVAEEKVDSDEAAKEKATEEALAEYATAEEAVSEAAELATAELAEAKETAVEEAEMAPTEIAPAKDQEAMMVDTSEVAEMEGRAGNL